jgi:hypothetical protein
VQSQPVPDELEGRMEPAMFSDDFLRSRRIYHSVAATAPVEMLLRDESDQGYQDAESQEQIMMRLRALGYVE